MRRPLAIMLGLLLAAASPLSAELQLHGAPVQGALIVGHAPPDARVLLDGEPLQQSASGHFLVGFARDDTDARRLQVVLSSGERIERLLKPADREFDIQRIDGLPPSKVTPDESVLARIRSEATMTREARLRRDDRSDFADGFIWPVTGPITGVYGSQRILNGQPRNPHWGIDIAAPVGTPVHAPAAGIVTLTHDDMYFSGGTLLLDHGLGLSSAFLHLSEILVESGQQVAQGDVVALVGATGRVTGAHLDWRMNLGATRVDPQLLLPPMPDRSDAPASD